MILPEKPALKQAQADGESWFGPQNSVAGGPFW